MSVIRLRAPSALRGPIDVPGDKSISHRAVLFSAIAQGTTRIENVNRGDDVLASIEAVRALGVAAESQDAVVEVRGSDELRDPAEVLDCGNSGTTMRVLCGMLAGRVDAVLDGDDSLRRRPMERVAVPLRAMGADVRCAEHGTAPIALARMTAPLKGITYELPAPSSQVKTAIMLAALRARGSTTVVSPQRSRDHSELMLDAMGASVKIDGLRVSVKPSALRALGSYRVPGDVSAAAYFIAAATCVQGSRISVLATGIN
ncbi:MAG: 3-phosphoshikimate 1-carboxyvinyltransferase, partial [Candidatus Eremiobacteraeota bacterium]|nr:3-phosphoshikimate 1-carboxyvinyltransferase [Candidatus Eremiobacteraeota bacterium]